MPPKVRCRLELGWLGRQAGEPAGPGVFWCVARPARGHHRPTLNPAVYLLSMVFGVGALLILGVWGGEIQRPCLEGVLPLWGGCSPWPGTHS